MLTGKLRAFIKRISAIQLDENGSEIPRTEAYLRVRAGNTYRTARSVASRISTNRSETDLESHLRSILEGADGKQAWIEYIEAGDVNRTDSVRLELVQDDEPDVDPNNASAALAQCLVQTVGGLQQLLINERELSNRLSHRLIDQSEATGRLLAIAEIDEERAPSGMGEVAKSLIPIVAQVAATQLTKGSSKSDDAAAPATALEPIKTACRALDDLVVLLERPDAQELLADPNVQERFGVMVSKYMVVAGL